ncbi:helix-turn-helix domain-containing protein [Glycomyces sp. NPDC047010]|uniref:TetR/AcrR family transcriptional regulator n=1 Tax=Glycomyces sp. NPDC047010 TaxID=3155023 RepID=UPI0033F79833
MGTPSGRRTYESLHRTEQAQRTRAEIAAAARRLFTTGGWAATTVRQVAQEAGVAVPTVYAAYGSKTGLALALADAADFVADPATELAGLQAAEGDPPAQLAAMAAYDRRLFERSGDLIAMLRDAGRTEPELGQAYLDGRRRADALRTEVFASWPAGALRAGVQRSLDVYAALCSIDVYNTLAEERSWSPDQIETWWAAILPRELLAD